MIVQYKNIYTLKFDKIEQGIVIADMSFSVLFSWHRKNLIKIEALQNIGRDQKDGNAGMQAKDLLCHIKIIKWDFQIRKRRSTPNLIGRFE